MVNNEIVFDNYDFEGCTKLYYKLSEIMKAYNALPILEEIHSNSGNKLLSTSCSSNAYYKAIFAEEFNKAIIEYVTKPVDQ